MRGKYETIVILSTLAEPKSIVEISTAWFGNKGRLYQDAIRKEINNSIKKGSLTRFNKTRVKANTNRFVREVVPHISLGSEIPAAREYRDLINKFYINLGEYTQKVYLHFEVIKTLCFDIGHLSPHKANDLDLRLLLQLPFLLRYLERKYPEAANHLIQAFKLEDYETIIDTLEFEHLSILRKHAWEKSWADCFLKVDDLMPKLQKKSVGILAKSLDAMRTLGSA